MYSSKTSSVRSRKNRMRSSVIHMTVSLQSRVLPEAVRLPLLYTGLPICCIMTESIWNPLMYWSFLQTVYFQITFPIFFRNWARKIFRRWVLTCSHTGNWKVSFRTVKTAMTSWKEPWSFRTRIWQNALKRSSWKALSEWWKDSLQDWKMNWWISVQSNIKEFRRQKKNWSISFISNSRMHLCSAGWMQSEIIVLMNTRHYLDVIFRKKSSWSYRRNSIRCM